MSGDTREEETQSQPGGRESHMRLLNQSDFHLHLIREMGHKMLHSCHWAFLCRQQMTTLLFSYSRSVEDLHYLFMVSSAFLPRG